MYASEFVAPAPMPLCITLLVQYTACREQSDKHSTGLPCKFVVAVCRSYITPVNKELIPTGDFEAVSGTPYDLNTARQLADTVQKVSKLCCYICTGRHHGSIMLWSFLQTTCTLMIDLSHPRRTTHFLSALAIDHIMQKCSTYAELNHF